MGIVETARRVIVLPRALWWSHNDHYHDLLLLQVPAGATRALDVGCGTGAFARRLAGRIDRVDAIDRSSGTLAIARERSSGMRNIGFVDADLFDFDGHEQGYHFISLIAVLHHMDLEAAASRLRAMLAPGGVIAVLGIAREDSLREYVRSVPLFVLNGLIGAWFALRRVTGRPAAIPTGRAATPQAPVRDPDMTFREVSRRVSEVLPGSSYRRLLFWRYLLVYRRPW